MQFFIFVLFICFLVFLFCLYFLVNDDFVLLRRDVSTERIFNIAFLSALASLFGARIFFAFLNQDAKLLSPLVFLAFPYFPGLSLLGGLLGGMAAFFALTRKDKIPVARLFDFFSISFLCPIFLGYLGYFLLSKSKFFAFWPMSLIIIYLVLFIAFIKYLLPNLLNGRFKEGSIGLIFLISFSVISLVENFVGRFGGKIYFAPHHNGAGFTFEDLILLVILLASSAFLINHEKLMSKIGKIRK